MTGVTQLETEGCPALTNAYISTRTDSGNTGFLFPRDDSKCRAPQPRKSCHTTEDVRYHMLRPAQIVARRN